MLWELLVLFQASGRRPLTDANEDTDAEQTSQASSKHQAPDEVHLTGIRTLEAAGLLNEVLNR